LLLVFGNFDPLNAIPAMLWFQVGVPILSSIGMYHPSFWPLVVHLLIIILVTAVVQIFYAYRIKLLADSYLIPSVVVLVSFVFMHLEWLVLICVVQVGITPSRRTRSNHTRCTECEMPLFS
jgi:hypothetical protein